MSLPMKYRIFLYISCILGTLMVEAYCKSNEPCRYYKLQAVSTELVLCDGDHSLAVRKGKQLSLNE